MSSRYRAVAALAVALAFVISSPLPGQAGVSGQAGAHQRASTGGAHDFDFLFGSWRVRHRSLRQVSPDRRAWIEFEGASTTRPVMGGLGNVEDNVLAYPSGTYRAAALRSFDAATGQWSIWWLDGRAPLGPLDPPVRGAFHGGVGTFYSDDMVKGRPVRTRYIWSRITPVSARWEQASSADAGATWETNWVMEFRRIK